MESSAGRGAAGFLRVPALGPLRRRWWRAPRALPLPDGALRAGGAPPTSPSPARGVPEGSAPPPTHTHTRAHAHTAPLAVPAAPRHAPGAVPSASAALRRSPRGVRGRPTAQLGCGELLLPLFGLFKECFWCPRCYFKPSRSTAGRLAVALGAAVVR